MTTLLVLDALMRSDDGAAYGYMIVQRTGLNSGTVFPILRRLERHGWITSVWETPAPEGRPHRRYYELTPGARDQAAALLRARAQRWKSA